MWQYRISAVSIGDCVGVGEDAWGAGLPSGVLVGIAEARHPEALRRIRRGIGQGQAGAAPARIALRALNDSAIVTEQLLSKCGRMARQSREHASCSEPVLKVTGDFLNNATR